MTRRGGWLALVAYAGFASSLAWGQAKTRLSTGPAFVTPNIVGPSGTVRNASTAQFSSVVAITYNLPDGQQYMCTGTLLTGQLVLTAGHCGCGLPGSYQINLSPNTRTTNQVHNVTGVPILYDQQVCIAGQLGGGNDLALLRLAGDVGNIGLAQGSPDSPGGAGYPFDKVFALRTTLVKGTRLTAVGYGYTSASTLGVRLQGEIPIFSFDCEERSLTGICAPFAEMILADTVGAGARTDTCGGDSGGPVFRFVNGIPHLIGVTSRAAPGRQDDPVRHCGGGGIYTLVGRETVHRWLQANGVPDPK